tara:strand:- start:616 stop:1395 length:780 start_codon:yes stop_codon:yes gene_type:complete
MVDSKEHKFIIRIDDYPTGVRDKIYNYRKFADQILNEFERYNIPYMLAIVPALLEPEDHIFLRNRHNMTVGMHGINHDQSKVGFRKIVNELTGNTVEYNLELLKLGRDLLGEHDTVCFIPPGNSYDLNLLKALAIDNFKLCFGTFPKVWHYRSPIVLLHASPPLYGLSRDVISHLTNSQNEYSLHQTLRRLYYTAGIATWNILNQAHTDIEIPNNLTQIALHWTWEWDEILSCRSKLSSLCEWLSQQNVISVNELAIPN